MAAAKLQYSDRISHSMRSSFVQLLDDNRKSFRISHGEEEQRLALSGDDDEVAENTSQQQSNQRPTLLTNSTNDPHTFTNLRKMALDITIQKTSIPAPHEKS
eukprot:scaffold11933_cov117-Skeletonema_dohrnii-CCMP3373.AAC.13